MPEDLFAFGSVALARVALAPTPREPTPQILPAATSPSLTRIGGPPGLLTEGIFLASRSLDAAGDSAKARVARTAYAVRARTRTTPNGVWAATSAAAIGGHETVLRLSEGHQAATVPSPRWLYAVADRHLTTPGVLDRLELEANNLAVRRGSVVEVEHPGTAGVGRLGSVAATDLSVWLLLRCAVPVRAADLIAEIRARYPGATAAAARTALTGMIRTGLLMTDLLPADVRDDPLRHLAERLPTARPEREQVLLLRGLLRQADALRAGDPRRLSILREARHDADELHLEETPLIVDTLTDADLRLPADVGRRAARAVALLWRIGQRVEPLRPWTRRFVETYGRHRMVPLLEALDPAGGIGPPGPEDAVAATGDLDEQRAAHLMNLLAGALAHGRSSIDLTPDDIQRLSHRGGLPPRTSEIHLRVAGRDGRTPLLIVGGHAGQDAGSAAGRFARRLPRLLTPFGESGPGDTPVPAEIVCRPLSARTAGLAPETGCFPHRIPVGVPGRPGDLHLADLSVAHAGGHLVLWSHALHRTVAPVLLSRITREFLPSAAQALHLLGHAAERPWHPWSWGPAATSPYTPRVTYHDVVLAPQRWRVPGEMVAAASSRATWQTQLQRWLIDTRPAPPARLVAEESDRHLLLDLDDADQREILRRTVASGTRTLTEAIGYHHDELPVDGPDGRHPLELVIPLHRRAHPPAPVLDPRTARRPRSGDILRPDDGWLSAEIAIPARHQDQALRQLPPLTAARLTYWLRYATPALGAHLRLRVHTDPHARQTQADLQGVLTAWAAALAEQRLSDGLLHLQPYVRETQRYGGPGAVQAAEAFFAADSALAQAALHLSPTDRYLLAAQSAAHIAATAPAPAQAVRAGQPLAPADRRRRDVLRGTLRTLPTPDDTAGWKARTEALTTLAERLSPEAAGLVVSDLVHMHCNRLVGTDASAERIVRSLAADLLYRRD